MFISHPKSGVHGHLVSIAGVGQEELDCQLELVDACKKKCIKNEGRHWHPPQGTSSGRSRVAIQFKYG
jgi:hypothetical protein